MTDVLGPGIPRGYEAFKLDDDTRAALRAAGFPPASKPTLPPDHPERVAIREQRARAMQQEPIGGKTAMEKLIESGREPTEFDRKVYRAIDRRIEEIREELADAYDNDDDDDPFGPTGRFFDCVTVPLLVVAFTTLVGAVASGLIWSMVMLWRAILQA